MKYKKELDELLLSMFEDWMTENDKLVFIDEVLKNMSEQDFDDTINEGIAAGYPIVFQLEMLKKDIKKIISRE